jgi:ATP-dependent protease ClpP protease subunit
MDNLEKIKLAESFTDSNPTEEQARSGNYAKGCFTFEGFEIVIENPKGSTRRSYLDDGSQIHNKMTSTYGYINGTIGKDGDELDVFIGDHVNSDFNVYVIDQKDSVTGVFDEHKIMFGYKNIKEAKSRYLECYNRNFDGFYNISELTMHDFKKMLNSGLICRSPVSEILDPNNVSEINGVKKILLEGEVIEDVTLQNLVEQTGDIDSFDTLVLEVKSQGGSVSEGLLIILWLDYLIQSGKKVVSYVSANAYSIASLIILAADLKIISESGEVMVHNPMIPEVKYANANELERYVSELRNLESSMYELYEYFTDLENGEIIELMNNETFMKPEDSIKYGLSDIKVKIKEVPFVMVKNNNKVRDMSKTINGLNKIIARIQNSDFVNQVYYTQDGTDKIEISQNDPSGYKIGDKTSVKEGQVKLVDGSVIVIENYTIKDIVKSAPIPEVVEPIVETPVVETPVETPVVETPVVETPVEAPVVETPVETPVVETPVETPVVETPVETPVVETPETEEEKVDVVNEQFNEGEAPTFTEEKDYISKEQYDELVAKYEEISAKLAGFENIINEKISGVEKVVNSVISDTKAFEDVTVEAIDVLHKNTVSSFKPSEPTRESNDLQYGSNSIFRRALAKRRGN